MLRRAITSAPFSSSLIARGNASNLLTYEGRESAFYVTTHAKIRKVRNLRKNKEATLLINTILVDWIRHVGTMTARPKKSPM